MASTWWGKAGIGLEYLLNRSGPMSMAPSQLGAFAKSDPGQERANLEFHVQPLSLGAFGAVSYTHLDVYKRQPCCCAGR